MHSFTAVEAEKEAEERRLLIPGGKPVYECVRCGALNEVDIQPRPAVLRCANCGYPVLKKPRVLQAKTVYTSKLSEEVRLFETDR
jgi:DNA-directed RNA polymerase subunit RPC12/RpoP